MATRFYFNNTDAPPFNPTIDAGWEVNGGGVHLVLVPKNNVSKLAAMANGFSISVPITTTQDINGYQHISDPIPPQTISGTFSMVIRCSESVSTANVTLAVVVRVLSQDGVRGTLLSLFGTDTEFAVSGSDATRIVNAAALTPVSTQPGDRICLEIGAHATGPTTTGTFLFRFGNNAGSDFALTSALTTDLNPWCEFSQTLYGYPINNYQFVKAPDGISVTEKIR